MIHEYAVDPKTLTSYVDCRYLLDQFGVCQGRLISRFPKDYKEQVRKACVATPTIEKGRIFEKLIQANGCFISNERTYDKKEDWNRNARRSHLEKYFRAIITTQENADGEEFLDHEALDSGVPLWTVDLAPVKRTATELCKPVNHLLRFSSEIVFVDQHFWPKAKHLKPLTQFLNLARRGKTPRRFEYHLNADPRGSGDFRADLEAKLSGLKLENDEEIVFVRWRTQGGGENLHARYIMTEHGGLSYNYGLDEGDTGETTDVQILTKGNHSVRWKQFLPGASDFEFVEAWLATSGGVVKAKAVGGDYIPE